MACTYLFKNSFLFSLKICLIVLSVEIHYITPSIIKVVKISLNSNFGVFLFFYLFTFMHGLNLNTGLAIQAKFCQKNHLNSIIF
jgi:hypothetical protein